MAGDLRVVFPNRPGVFHRACDALSNAGINVEGVGSDIRPGDSWGFVHFLVEDVDAAKRILEDEGFEIVAVHDVEIVQAENRPGSLADIVRAYSEKGENLEVLYTASDNRIVISTESMRQPIVGVRTKDAGNHHKGP